MAEHAYDTNASYLCADRPGGHTVTAVERPTFLVAGLGVDHWLKYGLFEEKPVMEWAHQFISKTGVMIDVGANVGTYTVEFAPRCAQVYAFEPQRFVYYQLCGNIALNNLRNVLAYNVALGSPSERGRHQLMTVMSPDCTGSSLDRTKIDHEKIIKPENLLGTEEVLMACLDDYDIGGVELIKIDVEGHELNVLQGGVEFLKRNRWPRVLFECWHEAFNAIHREDTIRFLEQLGYAVVPIRYYEHMMLATHPTWKGC